MRRKFASLWLALVLFISSIVGIVCAQESASNGSQPSEDVQIGEALELGHPVHVVDPAIPGKFDGKDACVVLSATMTKQGTFDNPAFADGMSELGETAINATKGWLYTPSTKAGQPVQVDVYVTFIRQQNKISTYVEPDLPFPTKPHTPIGELLKKGELFRLEPGMQPPNAIYAPDPDYSKAARAVKRQAVSVLGMIVEADGTPSDIWVKRKSGLGLDQMAVETLRKWKLRPAMKNGKPVAVPATIEVAFHLD